MSADDPADEETTSVDGETGGTDPDERGTSVDVESGEESGEDARDGSDVRDRLEEEADRAAQQIDESVVDLLAWVLDTETRARIYVELRRHPDSTSEEVADGTGLYPSTVREALAELHEEGKVHRRKRESDGAGNNPYEYRAMAPTDLVRETIGEVQQELNTVFNLDTYLGGGESDDEPVTINVEEEGDAATKSDDVKIDTEKVDTEEVDTGDPVGDDVGEDSDVESDTADDADTESADDEN